MSLKAGEGDALHTFGPVAETTERFLMILGALESGEAPLYNSYLDVSRTFIRKKTVAWKKNVTLIAKPRCEVLNSRELLLRRFHSGYSRTGPRVIFIEDSLIKLLLLRPAFIFY